MTDAHASGIVERIDRSDGETVAYVRSAGRSPGVMFLGGFMSDMTGTKATALEAFCRRRGTGFVRFDYLGHGASSGAFVDGTIGRWTDDAIAVLDQVTEGPQVLVGSSMGGWLMLLTALARPDRIHGLVGVAPAPDFTVRMMAQEFSAEQRTALLRDGRIEIPSEYDDGPYTITKALIDDGRDNLVLDGPIDLDCPVRLLYGMADTAVPWQSFEPLVSALATDDVTVGLIKNGDHRLSTPADIDRLCRTVGDLLLQPPE